MKILRLVAGLFLFSSASMLLAQTPAPAKDAVAADSVEPLVVDAHSSPYRSTIYYQTNISPGRFDMRDATVLDMIALAYKREDQAVIGGPTWIDFDRFDVAAKIPSLKSIGAVSPGQDNPSANPYDQLIRPMLKRVLAERFHLVFHEQDKPLPGYIVTVAKEGSKLTEAKDATAAPNCKGDQDKSTPPQVTITCTSQTVEQFFSSFGAFPHKVIDRTGLTKKYDFTMKLTYDHIQSQDDVVRLYTDVLRQQLGLVVAPGDVAQPAIVVDKVDHAPTSTPPEIAKQIPALASLEFEVASIRPAADNEPQRSTRPSGSQLTLTSYSLQELLVQAWQLPTGAMLGNRPDWIDHVRYTILVKLPPEINAQEFYQNQDQFALMLQKLLIDRFKIKYHWGEQTGDSYVLLPGTPKMKKADPNSRTTCDYGAPSGEKDMRRIPDSPYDRQFYCRNVTMAQFADVAQSLAGSEVKNRVPNKTGLEGSYDFTVYYTTGHKMRVDAASAADSGKQPQGSGGDSPSSPSGGLTVEDAFRKELGIRLEKQPLSTPALILDHIEQTPTEN